MRNFQKKMQNCNSSVPKKVISKPKIENKTKVCEEEKEIEFTNAITN